MEYHLPSKRKGIQTQAVIWVNLANNCVWSRCLIRTRLCDCTGIAISPNLKHYLLEQRWLIRLRKLIKLRRLRKLMKVTSLSTLWNSWHLPWGSMSRKPSLVEGEKLFWEMPTVWAGCSFLWILCHLCWAGLFRDELSHPCSWKSPTLLLVTPINLGESAASVCCCCI